VIARLSPHHHGFPDPRDADASGLVAVGGDDDPDRVWRAYERGIFPWSSPGQPRLWWSPDPRFVLPLDQLHVPRSLAQRARRAPYEIRYDTAFEQVLAACASASRPGQSGTWLTSGLVRAMTALHARGRAHSAEAWRDGVLVGGLYGLQVRGVFCGESMFAHAPDASKLAFLSLARRLMGFGVRLVDCQVRTDHLARFGAVEWPRDRFLEALADAAPPGLASGSWAC
jgi:leucyl/phenylalanyl-tRNA--protein transferase